MCTCSTSHRNQVQTCLHRCCIIALGKYKLYYFLGKPYDFYLRLKKNGEKYKCESTLVDGTRRKKEKSFTSNQEPKKSTFLLRGCDATRTRGRTTADRITWRSAPAAAAGPSATFFEVPLRAWKTFFWHASRKKAILFRRMHTYFSIVLWKMLWGAATASTTTAETSPFDVYKKKHSSSTWRMMNRWLLLWMYVYLSQKFFKYRQKYT